MILFNISAIICKKKKKSKLITLKMQKILFKTIKVKIDNNSPLIFRKKIKIKISSYLNELLQLFIVSYSLYTEFQKFSISI